MLPFDLHRRVFYGDVPSVQRYLEQPTDINLVDPHDYSPLMYAAASPNASVEMLQLLVEHGADVNLEVRSGIVTTNVIDVAIDQGNLAKLSFLSERGANFNFCTDSGYDALIRAAYSRTPDLIALLQFLVSRGVALNGITTYNESAIRMLSRIGRFDGVRFLLDVRADASRLEWTPLMYALAIGSLDDVKAALRKAPGLEERDSWSRTPWLIAIQTGDVDKAKAILYAGADRFAVGRGGIPALAHAIESGSPEMLKWLLSIGIPAEQADESGKSALISAVEKGNAELVRILLAAGADVTRHHFGQAVLNSAEEAQIVRLLLDSGADPQDLSFAGKRSLVGFPSDSHYFLLEIDSASFHCGANRRFGRANPEKMDDPFWLAMIRSGLSAAAAGALFDFHPKGLPIWCAQRFGQSMTVLNDGRIIQIGGEHEDSYDEDFCIYNDVFIHEKNGDLHIMGYPESVFAPTDFHTATMIGDQIYVIGGLGYPQTRRIGNTPVYSLNTHDFTMRHLTTTGEAPGWLYKHRAEAVGSEITVSGGLTVYRSDGAARPNSDLFTLDLQSLIWRQVPHPRS